MDSYGQHFIIDAKDCKAEILNDAKLLEKLLTKAVSDLGMEILNTHFHSFLPHGVTGAIILSTSHFSIHTWPEHRYAALDLYTCGNQELWPVLEELLIEMKAGSACVYELSRGHESKNEPAMKDLIFTHDGSKKKDSERIVELRDDRGNAYDSIQLKELVEGQHDILYHGSSQFQDITLVEANDLRLYLDQELQFSSLDERHYHEALVFPAMEMASDHERVLILGGGDGLALREVLKYPNVKHVDLVDIDPQVIELAKTNPKLITQNNRSLLDERVNIHFEDAKKFILRELQPYNVIIIDFPDPVDPVISSLYTIELFSQTAKILSKQGVLVCQSNSPEDTPTVFWSIGKTINKAGLNTLEYNVIVPSFGLWGFHLAAHFKLPRIIPSISVQHQALTSDMSNLFTIPSSIKEQRGKAVMNGIKNLNLHKLYKNEIEKW